ncbi:hypothetical protein B0G84_6217 [Paraburkholderia sp. BL8N3]|nr:hypothetical protein [Paraburkholderia sp. BL8N3]TCK37162.1 hypothetical protein B0G84_6217 [Paraburkholderia sp. BL8N3]
MGDALAAIPESDRDKPLSPAMTAELANLLWQYANSQSGYSGVPYSAFNPITADDVSSWNAANPSWVPTVGDAIAANPGNGSMVLPYSGMPFPSGSPGSNPGGDTGTGGGTDPGDGSDTGGGNTGGGSNPASQPVVTGSCGGPGQSPCEIDWGSNPNNQQPSLEATPTIQAILDPVFGMLSGFKSFQVPAHVAVCPMPSFAVFGQTYVLRSHCDLIEEHRAVITAAFSLMFLIGSVLVVLMA